MLKTKEQKKWWDRVYSDRCDHFRNLLGATGESDVGCGPGFS